MNNGEKKIEFLNIAKGLAIIAIVIGHTEAPIKNFLYLFHVPLFFFISGYLYKNIYSSQPLLLIKKRLLSLYVPFLYSEIIFLFFHNIFFIVYFYSEIKGLNTEAQHIYNANDILPIILNIFTFGNTEPLLVPLWFLASLFTVNIIFSFISYFLKHVVKIEKEYLRFLLIIICAIFGVALTNWSIVIPRFVNTSLVAILFFYSGFILKTNWYNYKFQFITAIVSLSILIISSFFVKVEMVTNRYSHFILFLINAFLGIYTTIFISKYISDKSISAKFISYIGNNSLYILILHLLAFKLIHIIQIAIYDYPIYYLAKITAIPHELPWWILYSIIGVFFPLLIPLAITKLYNLRIIKNHE